MAHRRRHASRNGRTNGKGRRRAPGAENPRTANPKSEPRPQERPERRAEERRDDEARLTRILDRTARVGARLLEVVPGAQQLLRVSGPVVGLILLGITVLGLLARSAGTVTGKLTRWLLIAGLFGGSVAFAVVVVVQLESGPQQPVAALTITTPPPPPALFKTHVGASEIQELDAFDRRFFLGAGGGIDVFDAQGQYVTTYGLLGRAGTLVACGGWLFESHMQGRIAKIARIVPWTGEVRGQYPSGKTPVLLVCRHVEPHDQLWASQPGSRVLFELDPRTMKYVYGDRIAAGITSIATGEINGYRGIWALDRVHGQLVGIADVAGQREKIGPWAVAPGATQILYAGTRMWLLYPSHACLEGFDSNDDLEDEAIPVAPGATHMSTSAGTIYLAGRNTITIFATSDPSPGVQVIRLRAAHALTDANEYGGMLMAADRARLVFGADALAQSARRPAHTGVAASCRP